MIYRFANGQLDSGARELQLGGQRVSAARRVFDLLLYLIEHRERAVGRDELVSAVWGRVDVADVQVSQLIARTRKLIGDDAQTQFAIRTIAGYGYRWVLPLQEVEAEAAAASLDGTASLDDDPKPVAPVAAFADSAATPESTRLHSVGSPLIPDFAALHPGHPSAAIPDARSQPRRGWTRSWRSGLFGAAVVLLVAVFALRWWPRSPPGAEVAAVQSAFVVLPLQVDGSSDEAWIQLGAMDLVSNRLRRAGVLVIPSESVLAGLHAARQQAPEASDARLAQILQSTQLVHGQASKTATGWRVSLRTPAADGSMLEVFQEDRDPMRSAAAATDLLLSRLGRSAQRDVNAPEALADQVQRIRAAILTGDLPGARQALERVPQALRGHPRIRLIRAELDYYGGQLDEATRQLGELLDDAELTQAERARVLLARGMLAIRLDQCADAEQRFEQALGPAASSGDAAVVHANALAGRGLARSCLGREAEAADDLGAARLRMEALSDTLGQARVDNYLGLLELQRGAPQRAVQHFQAALQRFDALAVVDAQRAVLSGLLDAHVQLLEWVAAAKDSDRLLQLRPQVSDPMQRQLLDSDRARVLIGSGQLDAAAALLEAAETVQPARGPALRLLSASRAELAWRRGDAAAARAAAVQALEQWPADESADRRWQLALIEQRAAQALGQDPATSGSTHEVDTAPTETRTGSPASPLQLLLAANHAASAAPVEQVEAQFQAAVQAAERQGIPATVLWVLGDVARWRLQHGQHAAAAALVGRTSAWAQTDFDAALLRLALFHAQGEQQAWSRSLSTAQTLTGQRLIPGYLLQAPAATTLGSDPLPP